MADLIEIEGPDGVVYEFPAGTSDEVMKGAMRRRFGEPEPEREPLASGPPVRDDLGEYILSLGKQERQAIYDFIGQTIGTGVGIAGGTTLGGPPGGIAGGAGGSVIGKQISRTIGPYIGGEGERPDIMSLETGVDAGMGAVGPVVGSVARGGSRLLTGLSREGVTKAEKAGERIMSTAERKKLAEQFAHLDEAFEMKWGVSSAAEAKVSKEILAELDKVSPAVAEAIKRAKGKGLTDLATRAVPGAGIGAMIDPTIGMLIGAGISDAVLKRAIPKMLGTPDKVTKFTEWALNLNKKTPKQSEITASFAALAADMGIKLDEIEQLRADPPRETSRPKPLRERRSERPRPPRDERGRFVGTFDHGPLEEMFEGGLG